MVRAWLGCIQLPQMQESHLSKPSSKVTRFVSQDAEINIQELRKNLWIEVIFFCGLLWTYEDAKIQSEPCRFCCSFGMSVKVYTTPASWSLKKELTLLSLNNTRIHRMFQKQVSLAKFLFPYLGLQQIVPICSSALVSCLCLSLELILYWVQKIHSSEMKSICLTLSLSTYKYVGFNVNFLFAFTEWCILERNLKACE